MIAHMCEGQMVIPPGNENLAPQIERLYNFVRNALPDVFTVPEERHNAAEAARQRGEISTSDKEDAAELVEPGNDPNAAQQAMVLQHIAKREENNQYRDG